MLKTIFRFVCGFMFPILSIAAVIALATFVSWLVTFDRELIRHIVGIVLIVILFLSCVGFGIANVLRKRK